MKKSKYILTLLLSIISVVGFSQILNADKFCFANPIAFGNSHQYSEPIAKDMDGDGFNDVVLYDYTLGEILIYKYTVSGFILWNSSTIANIKTISVGYVNNDTYPDVVALENTTSNVYVYMNNGSGLTYTTTLTAPVGYGNPKGIYLQDLDINGFDEITVTSYLAGTGYSYYIHVNDGTGNYTITTGTTVVSGLSGTSDPIITFGNFNPDGFMDMAYTSKSSFGFISMQNTNGGALYSASLPTSITVGTGDNCEVIKTQDFNNDLFDDIGYLNTGLGGGFKQLMNSGTGSFSQNNVSFYTNATNFFFVDMNSDFESDYISFNGNAGKYYVNKGFVTYPTTLSTTQYTTSVYSPTISTNFVVADFDKDGYPDIVTAGGVGGMGDIRFIKNYSYPVVSSFNNLGVICSGSPVTLYSTTDNIITSGTYSWSNGATTQTTTTNIVGAYTSFYNFNLPNGGSCTLPSDAITTTSVNGTQPTLSISSSTNNYCWGGPYPPVNLVLTAFGSATNYSWTAPGGNPLIGQNYVESNAMATQIYTATAELAGCYATQTIAPVGIKAPYINPDASNPTNFNICSGSSQTITVNTPDDITVYSWSPTVSSNSMAVVTPTTPVSYYTLTPQNLSCVGSVIVYTINLNPLPTINATISTPTICQSGTSSISYNSIATQSYATNPGNLTGSSINVTPTITTVYTVTATESLNGCTKDSTFTVYVMPNPTLSISPASPNACLNQSITLTGSGATTYTWNSGVSTASQTITPSVIGAITYTLAGTTNGCSTFKTVVVNVNSLPSISVNQTTNTACFNTTITFTASGGNSYTITPNGVSNGSVQTINQNILGLTTYSITGIDVNGCSNSVTSIINVLANPSVTISPSSSTVCSGETVTLTALGANTYTWSGSGLVSPYNLVTPFTSTTYSLLATGLNNCINSQSITINALANPTVSISSINPIFCSGVTNTLVANGAVTYTWLPGNINNANNPITPTIVSSYTLIGASLNGCTNIKSTTITPSPLPNISASANNYTICPIIDSVILSVSGSGSYNYIWDNLSTATSQTVYPIISQNYIVTATDISTGCSNKDTVFITVKPAPIVTASASNTLVCSGSLVSLNASGAFTYSWAPIGVISQTASAFPTSNITYTVYGVGLNGCVNYATIPVVIFNSSNLQIVSNPTIVCATESASLSLLQNYTSYNWSNGAVTPTTNVSPTTSLNTYTVSATDNNNCVYTGTIQIAIDEACNVTTYTGFSPNGDGINDNWQIGNINLYPNNTVYIFNRWGNKMYHTTNYDNVNNFWNGTFNGIVVPSGTYYYVIEYNNGQDINKGWVEVTGK